MFSFCTVAIFDQHSLRFNLMYYKFWVCHLKIIATHRVPRKQSCFWRPKNAQKHMEFKICFVCRKEWKVWCFLASSNSRNYILFLRFADPGSVTLLIRKGTIPSPFTRTQSHRQRTACYTVWQVTHLLHCFWRMNTSNKKVTLTAFWIVAREKTFLQKNRSKGPFDVCHKTHQKVLWSDEFQMAKSRLKSNSESVEWPEKRPAVHKRSHQSLLSLSCYAKKMGKHAWRV